MRAVCAFLTPFCFLVKWVLCACVCIPVVLNEKEELSLVEIAIVSLWWRPGSQVMANSISSCKLRDGVLIVSQPATMLARVLFPVMSGGGQ